MMPPQKSKTDSILTHLIFSFIFFLNSCNSYNKPVSVEKMSEERRETPRKFAEAFFKKCADKDYSAFHGFKLSNRLERNLASDSIKKSCDWMEKRLGTVKLKELVSVHTPSRPADFIDVFNYKLETEKSKSPVYLHIGLYRDQNYLEVPFYFNKEENYYASRLKKYRQAKKSK